MSDGGGSKPIEAGLAANWRILSVIFAALIASALMLWFLRPEDPDLPFYQPNYPKAAGYQADAANCSPKVLTAIGDVREHTRQSNACADKAEDYRVKTDDLIQQTRTADAAKAQAISASYQSWLILFATVGGFLTLIAAGLAAAYARDAAREGKRSADAAHDTLAKAETANIIAKRIGEATVQAHVLIENIAGIFQKFQLNSWHLVIEVTIKNTGQTVADSLNCQIRTVDCNGGLHELGQFRPVDLTTHSLESSHSIRLTCEDSVNYPIKDIPLFLEKWANTPFFIVRISYTDIFENDINRTMRYKGRITPLRDDSDEIIAYDVKMDKIHYEPEQNQLNHALSPAFL